jgi:hypothetical protein
MSKDKICLVVYYGGESHQYTSGFFTKKELDWFSDNLKVIKTAIELVEKGTDDIDYINIKVLKSIVYKSKKYQEIQPLNMMGYKGEGGQDGKD